MTVPYFLFSYIRFTYAIMQTKVQAAIREEIIATAKVNQNDQVEIPDWYFTKLAKETDKFDLFRSDAMPAYYGIKQIKWNPAYFNYAILKTKTNNNRNTGNGHYQDGLLSFWWLLFFR